MSQCTCEFVAPGQPMKRNGCEVHTKEKYACDFNTCKCHGSCVCTDYRPIKATNQVFGNKWPLCKCGHLAQDHNS